MRGLHLIWAKVTSATKVQYIFCTFWASVCNLRCCLNYSDKGRNDCQLPHKRLRGSVAIVPQTQEMKNKYCCARKLYGFRGSSFHKESLTMREEEKRLQNNLFTAARNHMRALLEKAIIFSVPSDSFWSCASIPSHLLNHSSTAHWQQKRTNWTTQTELGRCIGVTHF